MAKEYLDKDGLLYFWQKIKNVFVPQTRTVNGKALSADITLSASDVSALPASTVIPSAGTGSNYPVMDGTRSLGSQAGFARVDHVHPSDTSRVPTTRTVNGHALSSDVVVTASDIGVEAGAEVNVQSDWNVTDTTSDAYIKNKPTIPAGVVVDSALSSTSENPVQNKVINTALDGKVDKESGVGLSRLRSADQKSSVEVEFYNQQAGSASYSVLPTSAKGVANGVAPLNANSKIDATYLPSYVDDVVEAYPVSGSTPLSAGWLSATSGGSALTPEAGVIYILMADSGDYSANSQFRWSGSAYVKLADGGVSSITNAEIDIIVAS